MKWPFVSRERYDELKERCDKLEALVLPQLHVAAQPTAPEMPKLTMDTDLSKVQVIGGRPTVASVQAEANREAYKRATTPGAKSVTEELAETRTRLMRLKREVNGN